MLEKLTKLYRNQPLIINTVVTNAIALAVAFNVTVTETQTAAIFGAVNTVNLILTWFLVSPTYGGE
jgi:hypothetical protein